MDPTSGSAPPSAGSSVSPRPTPRTPAPETSPSPPPAGRPPDRDLPPPWSLAYSLVAASASQPPSAFLGFPFLDGSPDSSPIPPPPKYSLDDLERRTIPMSNGIIYSYFALPAHPRPVFCAPRPEVLPALPPQFTRYNAQSTVGRLFERPSPLFPSVPVDRLLNRPLLDRPPMLPMGAAEKRKREEGVNGTLHQYKRSENWKERKKVARHSEKDSRNEEDSILKGVDTKAVKEAFLRMAKEIIATTQSKNIYFEVERKGKLRCIVCQTSDSPKILHREYVCVHSLVNHAYYAQAADLRADHLGLHKAICVLRGWNYRVKPDNPVAYQSLCKSDAEANRRDLILWPPIVVVHNTCEKNEDSFSSGIDNGELDVKLKEMGFSGGKSKAIYGGKGIRGLSVVMFDASQAGLREAERLDEFFAKAGHGREDWARIPKSINDDSELLVEKGPKKGVSTRILYGYLATVSDLEVLDSETKNAVKLNSRKEPDLP